MIPRVKPLLERSKRNRTYLRRFIELKNLSKILGTEVTTETPATKNYADDEVTVEEVQISSGRLLRIIRAKSDAECDPADREEGPLPVSEADTDESAVRRWQQPPAMPQVTEDFGTLFRDAKIKKIPRKRLFRAFRRMHRIRYKNETAVVRKENVGSYAPDYFVNNPLGWSQKAINRLLYLLVAVSIYKQPRLRAMYCNTVARLMCRIPSTESRCPQEFIHPTDLGNYLAAKSNKALGKKHQTVSHYRPSYDERPTAKDIDVMLRHFFYLDYLDGARKIQPAPGGFRKGKKHIKADRLPTTTRSGRRSNRVSRIS